MTSKSSTPTPPTATATAAPAPAPRSAERRWQRTRRPDRPRRLLSVGLWTLQVVAALGFVGAAAAKLTGSPDAVATFDQLGWGAWPRYALAGLELLGAAALFVPPLVGLAGLAFVALTIGAAVVQLVTGGSVVMAAVLLVVSAAIAWFRRDRTAALLATVRRVVRPNRAA